MTNARQNEVWIGRNARQPQHGADVLRRIDPRGVGGSEPVPAAETHWQLVQRVEPGHRLWSIDTCTNEDAARALLRERRDDSDPRAFSFELVPPQVRPASRASKPRETRMVRLLPTADTAWMRKLVRGVYEPIRLPRGNEIAALGYLTDMGTLEVVEATGRAVCRCCGEKIAKGDLAIQYFYDFTGSGSWTAVKVQIHARACGSRLA